MKTVMELGDADTLYQPEIINFECVNVNCRYEIKFYKHYSFLVNCPNCKKKYDGEDLWRISERKAPALALNTKFKEGCND